MRAYTYQDLQAIIDEAFRRGVEWARSVHREAPIPAAPAVHEVVDHPFESSDAPGQPKRPWLEGVLMKKRGDVTREADHEEDR